MMRDMENGTTETKMGTKMEAVAADAAAAFNFTSGLIEAEEIRQIQSDIKRCVNFHPLLRLELIQKQLVALIVTFLSLNKDFAYIQGLDSIAVVLFT